MKGALFIVTLLLPLLCWSEPRAYTAKDQGDGERAKTLFIQEMAAREANGGYAFAVKPPPYRVQKEMFGFKFAADLSCSESRNDAGFCSVARPKAWLDKELLVMERVLGQLESENLRPLLAKVRGNGFDTVFRYGDIAGFDRVNHKWFAKPYSDSTHHSHLSIEISDSLFELSSSTESFRVTSRKVVHSLAHAADFARRYQDISLPTLSLSADFLKMTRFHLNRDGRWVIRDLPAADQTRFLELFNGRNREILGLQGVEDHEEAFNRNGQIFNETAQFARRHGFPTLQAMLNPYECFAEWAVAVHYDGAAAKALNPQLSHWMEEKVLR